MTVETNTELGGDQRPDARKGHALFVPADQNPVGHSDVVKDDQTHDSDGVYIPAGQSWPVPQDHPGHAGRYDALIGEIQTWYREYVFAEGQRLRNYNAMIARLRYVMGWHDAKPGVERERIQKRAVKLMKIGKAVLSGTQEAPDDPVLQTQLVNIEATLGAMRLFEERKKNVIKELEKLARGLPIFYMVERTEGFAEKSLAMIIAEAGDLSNYPTKGHLRKRMCIGVVDSIRQGGLPKTASADNWIRHGYSGRRRSILWKVGDAQIKHTGGYYDYYLDRCKYEYNKAIRDGLIPATTQKDTVERWRDRGLPVPVFVKQIDHSKHRSVGHMRNRAKRRMEQKILSDLRREWLLSA